MVADFKIKLFFLACLKPNLKLGKIATISVYKFWAQIQIFLGYVTWYSADENEPGHFMFSADWTQISEDAEAT